MSSSNIKSSFFKGAMQPAFLLMDYSTFPHRVAIVDQYKERDDIRYLEWQSRSLSLPVNMHGMHLFIISHILGLFRNTRQGSARYISTINTFRTERERVSVICYGINYITVTKFENLLPCVLLLHFKYCYIHRLDDFSS